MANRDLNRHDTESRSWIHSRPRAASWFNSARRSVQTPLVALATRVTRKRLLFCLDVPERPGSGPCVVGANSVIAGWLIPPPRCVLRSITVYVDGTNVAEARHGFPRPDVLRALPGCKGANNSGFEATLSLERWVGHSAELVIEAEWGDVPSDWPKSSSTCRRRLSSRTTIGSRRSGPSSPKTSGRPANCGLIII